MWLGGTVLALLVFGGPTLALWWVTEEAKACFASIAERETDELPACDANVRWLERLEELPFIGRAALRAREEVVARMAVWRYVDAAVGAPSREGLDAHFGALKPSAYAIWEGSMRLKMDEVGPRMPVPEPGALAFFVGDGQTLDTHAFSWTQHYTATHALEAALLRADLPRAVRLAEHYQGRPASDLRIRVGALLCVGGQHQLGMDQVTTVERDRAANRSANFSRNYGDARMVAEACAAIGKLPTPPPPPAGDAGRWDQRERLMTMRLRLLRAAHPACRFEEPTTCPDDVRLNVDHARDLLVSDRLRHHRLALVASLADALPRPEDMLAVASPQPGEPTLADVVPRHAAAWLSQPDDAPFVPAERYAASALHTAELDRESPLDLAPVVTALHVRAAIAFARRGELDAADRHLATADLDDVTRTVLRAQAALVTGNRNEARTRANAAEARHPWLLHTRAELALPDVDRARTLATEALAHAKDPHLIERARWLLMALGVSTVGQQTEPTTAPERFRGLAWPSPTDDPAVRQRNLDETLAAWHAWLTDDNHRRARYRALAHRGSAPSDLAPLLHAGAQIGPPTTMSLWLNALTAFDARRYTIRQVAFARWRAALWRNDARNAARWLERYRTLSKRGEDPASADLLRAVRL